MIVEMWVLLPHENFIARFGTTAAISIERIMHYSGGPVQICLRKLNSILHMLKEYLKLKGS